MTKPIRSILLGCLAAIVCFAATSCEDSAAKARKTAHVAITKASGDYQAALTLAFDPASNEARAKLQSVISALGGVSGDPAQQAAASIISASAHMQLGTMDSEQAQRMETALRQQRQVVRNAVELARRLESLAAARAAHDDAEFRRQLDLHQSAGADQLRAFSQQVQELSAPIADLNKAIGADSDQVNALRSEYNQLYGRAQELGPMDGFSLLEQAITKLRAAQEIEKRIADRQAELEYNYAAEHQLAQTRATQLQSLLEQIQKARADLERVTQAITTQTTSMQERVGEFRTQIADQVAKVKASMTADLSGLMDSAASHFESAAQAASRAKGSTVNAATAQQSLANLHWARARMHSDQASMLAEVAQVKGMESHAAESKTAQSAAEAAAKEAVAAMNEAKASLEQAAGDVDAASLNKRRADIDAALAAMQAAAIDWLAIASAAPLPAAEPPAPPPVADPPATTDSGTAGDTSDK